jgi:hypothetical protein
MLVAAGLLKPFGHLARNTFGTGNVETLDYLRLDKKWLACAGVAISNYWRTQNASKGTGGLHPIKTDAQSNVYPFLPSRTLSFCG